MRTALQRIEGVAHGNIDVFMLMDVLVALADDHVALGQREL